MMFSFCVIIYYQFIYIRMKISQLFNRLSYLHAITNAINDIWLQESLKFHLDYHYNRLSSYTGLLK